LAPVGYQHLGEQAGLLEEIPLEAEPLSYSVKLLPASISSEPLPESITPAPAPRPVLRRSERIRIRKDREMLKQLDDKAAMEFDVTALSALNDDVLMKLFIYTSR
jgi:hypothetical protein